MSSCIQAGDVSTPLYDISQGWYLRHTANPISLIHSIWVMLEAVLMLLGMLVRTARLPAACKRVPASAPCTLLVCSGNAPCVLVAWKAAAHSKSCTRSCGLPSLCPRLLHAACHQI
jgi:hypothetical protein